MVVVLRNEQRLLITRKLHLRPNHIDGGCQALIVLILSQLFEDAGSIHSRLCCLDFGRRRFRLQIEAGGLPDNQVAGILIA